MPYSHTGIIQVNSKTKERLAKYKRDNKNPNKKVSWDELINNLLDCVHEPEGGSQKI